MDLPEIKPISPIAESGSALSRQGLSVLAQLARGGQSVQLQVLKVLSENLVSFGVASSPGGRASIALSFADVTPFTTGDRWLLLTEARTNEPVLRPLVSKSGLQERGSTRFHAVDRTSSVLSTHGSGEGGISVDAKSTGEAAKPSSLSALEASVVAHRHDAAVRQNSLSGLFGSLSLVRQGALPVSLHVPGGSEKSFLGGEAEKAIQDIARQILGLRLNANVTSHQIRSAVLDSGVFHEAKLLKSGGNIDPLVRALGKGHDVGRLSGDLKQQMQDLLALLVKVGGKPNDTHHRAGRVEVSVPPERDGILQGQRPVLSQGVEVAKSSIGQLMDRVIEGIARIKLLQIASLPTSEGDHIQVAESRKIQVNIEIPLALNFDQTAILGLRIQREGGHADGKGHDTGGRWSIDLAMDTEETGALDAHIYLSEKGGIHVSLWAEDGAFSALLQDSREMLETILADEGLDIARVRITKGRRADLSRYTHHEAGYFLDSKL